MEVFALVHIFMGFVFMALGAPVSVVLGSFIMASIFGVGAEIVKQTNKKEKE